MSYGVHFIAHRKLEAQRRKEKSEAHLYMQVQVVLEDYFEGHHGNDLFDIDKCPFRMFRVKKTAKLTEFMEMLSENLVSCKMVQCINCSCRFTLWKCETGVETKISLLGTSPYYSLRRLLDACHNWLSLKTFLIRSAKYMQNMSTVLSRASL